jgi:hypothetical protein
MEPLEPPNRPVFIILFALAWGAATFLLMPRGLAPLLQGAWIASIFVGMFLVDRLYVAWWRRHHAPDPMTLHWSELTNRDGDYCCAACHGNFLLPPPDLDPEKMVTCGHCGHVVAPYGEMQPFLHALAEEKLWNMPHRGPRWW